MNKMEDKQIKLDLKDRKILHELDFHARMSYSQLAKKVGLSKQGVEYKLNNLIKKGVIKGFYPVINVPKLGYLYCRLALVLRNVTDQKEKEILDYLKKDHRFFWIFTIQGILDIFVALWVPTISEFQKAISDLFSKYGKYIKSKNESVTTDVVHYQNRYFLQKKETEEIHIQETKKRVKLQELDIEILKLLCKDARMSIVSIASKLKISPQVANYRIKKLEREKIIEGYRPIIDHNKLGYTYYKLWINTQFESIDELNKLYNYIKNNPIVIYIVKGIGFLEDLDIEIMVKDNRELFNFIKDLRQKFPKLIGDYKTFMFTETIKVRYLPF